MDESEPFFNLKRGRPRKLTKSEYQKRISWLQKEQSELDLRFKHHQTEYINQFFTERVRNMIQEILRLLRLPPNYKVLPLQQITEEAIKQMMLSEIELAGFGVIILNQSLDELDYPLEELIKICVFSTKSKIEGSCEILNRLKVQLLGEINNFIEKLSAIEISCELNIKSISKMYKRLKTSILPIVNYSHYVDEIIRVSPPYKVKVNEKKSFLSTSANTYENKFAEEEAKINNLYSQADKIMVKEKPLDQLIPIKKVFNEEEKYIQKTIEREAELWYPQEDNEYGLEKLN